VVVGGSLKVCWWYMVVVLLRFFQDARHSSLSPIPLFPNGCIHLSKGVITKFDIALSRSMHPLVEGAIVNPII
jgi:hypothetical protein